VLGGEGTLLLADLVKPQVVEAELGGQPRLVVAVIHGAGGGDVRPLREPLAPPTVVLGNRVELAEIEGDEAGPRLAWRAGIVPCPCVAALREGIGLRQLEARLAGEDADGALDGVGGGSVDGGRLRVEVLGGHAQRTESL